jgi:hypothetical protein
VTTIRREAFQNNALTSITIPNSVTTIGSEAFELNALTSVTIPDSVTTIGYDAFVDNFLRAIIFKGNRPVISESYRTYISSLQCVSYVQGKTGWPGKPINGLVPTSSECSTTATSATSTTSTTVPATTTTIPVSTSSTTVPATTTTIPVGTTTKLLVTLGATTARTIALSLGMRVPSTARASLVVAKKSKSVCRVSKDRITALKMGRCTVNVIVTHKTGWTHTKSTTLAVSRIS